MKEEKVKSGYVTEDYLDKRLAENNQILLGAIDSILSKRFSESDMRVDSRFEAVGARLDEIESGLGNKTDNINTLIDGYVKSQEDSNQEFAIVKEEIGQMKKIIKSKFGVEIRAVG